MIREIKSDELHLISDDPVRPHISANWRLNDGRKVLVLENDDTNAIDAIICVAFTKEVPITEEDLNSVGIEVAAFYTVWSYTKGAGRTIVNEAAQKIKREQPEVTRFVTLSPLTEMAERFHLSNGASFLRKGNTCQNFEYIL
jgi:hypothetical protein